MLKLHTLAQWMYGFLDPESPYGLPGDMYDDVIPSGIHTYTRADRFYPPPLPVKLVPCRGAPASARGIFLSCIFAQNRVFYYCYPAACRAAPLEGVSS